MMMGPRRDFLPRPPRCRRFELSPLPRLTAGVSYHTGLDQYRSLDPMNDQGSLHRRMVMGVALRWYWRRRDPASCRRRFEAYHIETTRRNERQAFLASELFKVSSRTRQGRDMRAAIADTIARDRLSHLVGIPNHYNQNKEIR
jgi:hypothetical protein